MGRHTLPPFNLGDWSILTNLMNNSKVAKVVTYPETASPGFVGAVSAADKLRLIDDSSFVKSTDNPLSKSVTLVDFIHVNLGAVYAVSHIRWTLDFLSGGSGGAEGTVDVSDDNFTADTVELEAAVAYVGNEVQYIWQVNKNIQYLRLHLKSDTDGARTLGWYPLLIYGNAIQL